MRKIGDRYALLALVGTGESAEVYRAKDVLLGVDRALKLLSQPHRSAWRRRFRLEARTMARLSHPSILRVYDFGVDAETGTDYFVMDFAPGGSLDARLQRDGPLSLGQAARYMLQVLSALEQAHEAGIIHRDVKPQNILIGQNNRAMLGDFGIAWIEESITAQAGSTVGTMVFMAPEQHIDSSRVDVTVDLYALCASLYLLLTGETPADLCYASPRSPRWEPIPASLQPVLQRAMHTSPAMRYSSAGALREALLEALEGLELEVVEERPVAAVPDLITVADPGSPVSAPVFNIAELHRFYLATLNQALTDLTDGRAKLESGQMSTAELKRIAHRLSGSAGSFGYPLVGRAALAVEQATGPAMWSALDALLHLLRTTVSQVDCPQNTSILIVEDDPPTQALLLHSLSQSRRQVHVATTAREASERLIREDFSLVVLDLMLPDADGRELLASIRADARTAELPVLVVSARATPQIRSECFALGAIEFFEKPLDAMGFSAAIQKFFSRSNSPDEGSGEVPLERSDFCELVRLAQGQVDSRFCIAILLVDTMIGQPVSDSLMLSVLQRLQRELPGDSRQVLWDGNTIAVLLPGVDLTGGQLILNLALEQIRTSGSTEMSPLGFSAGVIEPEDRTLVDALYLVERAARLARTAGPRQVVAASLASTSALQVLFAEDDDAMAMLIQNLPWPEEVEVLRFENGEALLSALPFHTPSLILLDMDMPVLDGFSTLQRLRQDPVLEQVPIVMLTVYGEEEHVVRAFSMGADDYVLKPFAPAGLAARLRRMLQRSR